MNDTRANRIRRQGTSTVPSPKKVVTYYTNLPIPTLPALINATGTVFNIPSNKQYYFYIPSSVASFTLTFDLIPDVTLTNVFDPTNFSNCKLSIAVTAPLSASAADLFVTNSVTIANTTTGKLYTFSYFTTGSVIAGISQGTTPLVPPPADYFLNSYTLGGITWNTCSDSSCLSGTGFDPAINNSFQYGAGDDSTVNQIIGLSSGAVYAPVQGGVTLGGLISPPGSNAHFITDNDPYFSQVLAFGAPAPLFSGEWSDSSGPWAYGFAYADNKRFIEGETIQFANWPSWLNVNGNYKLLNKVSETTFSICCTA